MPTIIDYLEKNKDRSLKDFPLTDADILCLNEIGYFSFGDFFDENAKILQKVKIRDILQKNQNYNYNFLVTKTRVDLLNIMLVSKRFSDLRLSHYINDVDVEYERQFAAMVFSLPEINYSQLVFRGTDDTLIGWKEDFKLTYMREISAHRSAISYLEDYLSHTKQNIVISGHSKGGNLAIYATSHIQYSLCGNISQVYMFDSPGLQKKELDSFGYQTIRNRVRVIRPEESIVGVMLYNDIEPEVIQSQASGIMQHAATNWQVNIDTGNFIRSDKPTELSITLEKTFKQWTDELSNQELKILFDTLFDTLMTSGIKSLNDLSTAKDIGSKLTGVIANFNSINADKKLILVKSAKLFITTFAEYSNLSSFNIKPDFNMPDLAGLKEWFGGKK